jgi:hypothetical protein
MWGETDDEKNWNFLPTMLQPAITVLTPPFALMFTPVLAPAVSQNIPKDPKPVFC